MRTLALASLLLWVPLWTACGSEVEVTGIWQTPEDASVDLSALQIDQQVLLEIVAVQYGKDVSGLLRLFTQAYAPSHLWGKCPCMYLESADFRSDKLSFLITLCADSPPVEILCPGTEGDCTVTGVFTLDENDPDRMTGRFFDSEGTMIREGIELERVGDDNNIREEGLNLGCPE